MVLDTSALLTVLLNEPDAPAFRLAIEADPIRLVSAATLVETAIVIEARVGEAGGRELDSCCKRRPSKSFRSMPSTPRSPATRIASSGRGITRRRSTTAIAFYALAQAAGEPLLFKGNDFNQTDVTSVDLTQWS